MKNDARRDGSVIKKEEGVSAIECITMCLGIANCVAWSFEMAAKMCHFMSSQGQESEDFNFVSGFKTDSC